MEALYRTPSFFWDLDFYCHFPTSLQVFNVTFVTFLKANPGRNGKKDITHKPTQKLRKKAHCPTFSFLAAQENELIKIAHCCCISVTVGSFSKKTVKTLHSNGTKRNKKRDFFFAKLLGMTCFLSEKWKCQLKGKGLQSYQSVAYSNPKGLLYPQRQPKITTNCIRKPTNFNSCPKMALRDEKKQK